MYKLDKIKGKKLIRFRNIVEKLKPGTGVTERTEGWSKIKDKERRSPLIDSFLIMKGFTPRERRKILSYTLRLVIPWRFLLVSFVLLIVSLGIWRYTIYYSIPRLYTYGNNVPVYASATDSSSPATQLDIFGLRFAGGSSTPGKAAEEMLKTDSAGEYWIIQKTGFLNWLLNTGNNLYVKKSPLIISNDRYQVYKTFFRVLKGDSTIVDLDNDARRIILELTERTPSLQGAILANDYPEKQNRPGFSKIICTDLTGLGGKKYIHLRLKSPTATQNLVISYDSNGRTEYRELEKQNNQELKGPGLFRKSKMILWPDILFLDTSLRIWRSQTTPYHRFEL